MDTRNNIPVNAPAKEEPLSIKDIWNLCISHWYWFAIAVAICLAVAAFYILRTTPVYTRSASVLIKEDSKGRSVATDVSAAFSDLGFGQTRVNVNNEIVNFKSPDLMLQVVKNLNLNVNYKIDGRMHDWSLYGSGLPMNVQFLSLADNDKASLTVTPEDSASVVLSAFTLNEKKTVSDKIIVHYGDTVKTPVGDISVVRTMFAKDIVFDFPIYVTRSGLLSTARSYSNRLRVRDDSQRLQPCMQCRRVMPSDPMRSGGIIIYDATLY